jgi:hypothetical protein
MGIAKREKAWKDKILPGKQYSIDEALKMVKEFATSKFNGGASQGDAMAPSSRLRSKQRGRSGPCQSTQPVGGWRWYMWVAGPKKPSLPSSRS